MAGTAAATIVGRETELAAVGRFLDADGGPPSALVIEGEAGIGKTTVFGEAVRAADARGYRVLEAQPAEGEAKLSYAALSDLVGAVFDEAHESLPVPQERALGAALLRGEIDAPADPRTTATALVSLLTGLAADGPLLLAIDDVHWLDRASERALEFAARRLPPGLAILLTRRAEGGAEAPLGLGAAIPEDDLHRLVLGPLSLAALHHLVKRRLGTSPSRPTLLRLETASRGNPLYALELARGLTPEGRFALGEALPVPADLGKLLAARVARLPAETRDALLVAAASTRPTTALVDEEDLTLAEEAGVVRLAGDAIEFVHPLLAAAVYASASVARRRELHGLLAVRVEDPEERARHLALAVVEPNEDVARLVEAGADRARARGAPDAAGELLEEAARLTPEGGAARCRRLLAAAENMFHAGDSRHAQALLEQVLASVPENAERGRALRLVGQIRYTEESFPEAIRLFEQALEHVDAPEVAIPIMLDLAFSLVSVNEIQRAREHSRNAVAQAQRLGAGPLLGEALAVDAIVGFLCGEGVDEAKLARALELEDLRRPLRLLMRPTAIAAQLAFHGEKLSEARVQLQAIRRWAFERGEESELPFLLYHLAGIEWRTGRYDSAIEVADEALRIVSQTGAETMRSVALIHRAMARTFLGNVGPARADLEESRSLMERTGWKLAVGWAAMASGFLEITVGDAVAAERALAPLVEEVERGGLPDPWFALFVPDAVEALVALGAADRAERLVAAFEGSALKFDRLWARAEAARSRSLVLAASGDLDGALVAAEESLSLGRDVEMPFYVGRTLLVKGQVHRRRKEKRFAREALEQALQTFEGLRSSLWADRARDELRRVGLRPPPAGDLTETERRVAELAAAGHTNREVAQTLFISPKTVEATLSRVYGKLGIRSRAELGARMAALRS